MEHTRQHKRVSLSVIIPARNEAQYLPACLDSIRENTSSSVSVECVVVDNGSTDRTAAIAREKGALVVESRARTIAAVRNEGVGVSSGRFLAFLDADCTVEAGWAEAIQRSLELKNVVAVGNYPHVAEEGTTWVQKTWSFLLRVRGEPERARWLPSANLAVRRDAFEAAGGFDESLTTCEDADLSYRLARRGTLLDDPEVLVLHHREPASLGAFLRKEIWHGKDSYHRLRAGGMVADEIPSLIIPLLALSFSLLFLAGLLSSSHGLRSWPLHLGWIGLLTLPSLLTLRAVVRKGAGFRRIFAIFTLYSCYVLARVCALVLGFLGR
jgi:glycosyltransferase involved in cell wall biosynthesis